MTIAQRLYAQIFATVVALTTLAAIGVYEIERVYTAANFTNVNVVPSMLDLESAFRGFASVRSRSWQQMVLTDPVLRDENSKKIGASHAKLNAAIDHYEKFNVADDNDRALLNAIKAVIKQFDDVNDKALALSDAGKLEEARTLIVSNQAFQAKVNDAFEAHADYNAEIGKRSAQDATAIQASATRISIAIAIVAILLIAAMGILLARKIVTSLKQAIVIAQTVAAGDLSGQIDVKSKDEIGQLLQALKEMNGSLVTIVGDVRVGIDTISTASTQIAAGNLDLSSRTEEQAASLEETASSMEELTSTVKQNADNAVQANQLATSASEVARKGGAVVSEVISTMGSINESARKIVDIISVIDGIAFQTNILALNAAVEAARAGEQGRGFAVVASEVRNLAQRSASAAKEIKILIDTSVEKVDAGTRLVDQAGATMSDVVASVGRVSDIISEITAASKEQSAGIEQINQAITQMDEVTQQNAALVEQAAAAAASLQEQAGQLSQSVQIFKLRPNPQQRLSVPLPAPTEKQRAPLRAIAARSGKHLPPAPRLAVNGPANGDWEQF